MNTTEAITYLDNLRRAVLTVQGPNGPQPVCGADHDIWREAIETLRAAVKPEPAVYKGIPPAP
jgi:hypothetical protein